MLCVHCGKTHNTKAFTGFCSAWCQRKAEEYRAAIDEVERLRERVEMATEYNCGDGYSINMSGDSMEWCWTIMYRGKADRRLPVYPTADAAFDALAAWRERGEEGKGSGIDE